MDPSTRDQIYRDSVAMDIHDVVKVLNDNIGAVVVQAMARVKNRTQPARWAVPGGAVPRPDAETRIRLGYRVWRTIVSSDGPDVALAWLMGANPRLAEEPPIALIQEGRAAEVLGAAEAFVGDVYAP